MNTRDFLPPGPQAGFTLVELTVATALMAGLILVVMVLFNQTLLLAQTMQRRLAFNTEARLAFELLGHGGMRSFGPDSGGPYVYNTAHPNNEEVIRGFGEGQTLNEDSNAKVTGSQTVFLNGTDNPIHTVPLPWLYFNQLQWSRHAADPDPLSTPDSPQSVDCPTSPHPSCGTAPGQTKALGRVFSATWTDRQTAPNKLVDVKLELVDPAYMVTNAVFQASDAPFLGIPPEAKETYRTSFYLAGGP